MENIVEEAISGGVIGSIGQVDTHW